jgi:hypothetical protein
MFYWITAKACNVLIDFLYLMFRYAHHLIVKRLRFRPVLEQNNKTLQLASGGADHSVKIYNIKIDTIAL